MKETNATTQLEVIERMTACVEKAKEILGDESYLDALEGPEAQNLSELGHHLIDAGACLRALRKQLKLRVRS
jgi:hypothetical protein